MKTIFTTAAALMLMLSTVTAGDGGATIAQKERTRKALAKEIRQHFHFPDLGGSSGEAIAFAEFRITEAGAVELVGVNAHNENLRSFIADHVKEMQLKPGDVTTGETFMFKLRFRNDGI